MKSSIKIIFFILCLLSLPISANADYPSGVLSYSDDITVGSDYTWQVTSADFQGDFSSYSSYANIGGTLISEGDEIKLTITDDPDIAVDEWYDMYLNDYLLPSSTLGDMFDVGFDQSVGGFFINPVNYNNATGTYNIYTQIIEEYEQENVETSYSTSQISGSSTSTYYSFEKMEFKIVEDIFISFVHGSYQMSIVGGGYDITQSLEMKIETTANIYTGLLGKMDVFYDLYFTGYSVIDGTMHFAIESPYASLTTTQNTKSTKTIPYAFGLSLIGLLSLSAVLVFFLKRRRI